MTTEQLVDVTYTLSRDEYHDLRSALGSVIMAVDCVQSPDITSFDLARFNSMTKNNAYRMLYILNRVEENLVAADR